MCNLNLKIEQGYVESGDSFASSSSEDIPSLQMLASVAIVALFNGCFDLAAMKKEDIKALKNAIQDQHTWTEIVKASNLNKKRH